MSAFLIPLAACHAYRTEEVADPNAITVPDALASLGDGMRTFINHLEMQPNPVHLGIIACRLFVTFNISATASASDKATATLAAPIRVVDIGFGGEVNSASNASRGNAVTMEFDSVNPQICGYYNSTATYTFGAGAQSGGSQSSTDTASNNSKSPAGAQKGKAP